MIYQITVPSQKLPIAAQFVHYLYAHEFGEELTSNGWHDQVTEGLTLEVLDGNEEKLEAVLNSPARRHIRRALNVTAAMMAGNDKPLRDLIGEKEHIFIVGAPRSGGTYLLKECMRAVGKDYTTSWGPLYHDSFPPLTSFREKDPEPARSMKAIYGLAQYFVMASLEEGEVIPKKLHTLVAMSAFANKYLQNVYITRRHPMDSCMSTLAKAGGMPVDRRMPRDRTNIERQAWDFLSYHGYDPEELRKLDYWEFYLRYYNAYNREAESLRGERVDYRDLPSVASKLHEKYQSELNPEAFHDTEYDRTILTGGIARGDQRERDVELQGVEQR